MEQYVYPWDVNAINMASLAHLTIVIITSANVQHMSLAGRCRVRGNCGCKHDTVDLWLLTILQDLALASYIAVLYLSS